MKKIESEKNVEKRLCARAKQLGGLALKLLPWVFTGLPDRLILLPGGYIRFVETKTTFKKLSNRQKFVHPQLRKLGFVVEVIDTNEKVDQFYEVYTTSISNVH